tara:strand:+ start:9283 stop:9501 length:219 start_codon:yes stop_codon:yes gene_type:complete
MSNQQWGAGTTGREYVQVTLRDNVTNENQQRLYDTDYRTVKDAYREGSLSLGDYKLVNIKVVCFERASNNRN